jgi:hypothetical protein
MQGNGLTLVPEPSEYLTERKVYNPQEEDEIEVYLAVALYFIEMEHRHFEVALLQA